MNTKIVSIKKRFVSICNKLTKSSVPKSCDIKASTPVQKLRLKSVIRNHDSTSSSVISSIKSVALTTSSGYGTSVNLDNYLYDDHFSSIKTKAQENVAIMKANIVQSLLNYQDEFICRLKHGLESIRPLSVLMDTQLFYDIFQNIEKIHAISVFVQKAITDAIYLNQNIFASTVSVYSDYLKMLVSTFETYLNGYARAEACLNNPEFTEIYAELSELEFLRGFDLLEFIDMPIKNVTKIFCTFMSLHEIMSVVDQGDYEVITSICNQLKMLVGTNCSDSLEEINSSEEEYSVLPRDFVDENGKKYYFV